MFRSDRDGISNLYSLDLHDGALRRITNVLGGAFAPDVSPDGRRVVFADYGARGYDLRLADLAPNEGPAAEPFRDPYPAARAAPSNHAPTAAIRQGLALPRF